MTTEQKLPNPLAAAELHLASLYLAPPVKLSERILAAHGLALDLKHDHEGPWKGTLAIDPNSCSVDGWGDRQACTKMAVRPINVVVIPMRTHDPHNLGRTYCRVEGEGLPQNSGLIVGEDGREIYLNLDGQLVPLFARPRA